MNSGDWDTHSINPYVSEYIRPLGSRESGREYTYEDLVLETFALLLWKFQEDYHIDYMSAFIMAEEYRVLSDPRLRLMFGDAGPEAEHSRGDLFRRHPEARSSDVKKELPARNVRRVAVPLDNGMQWWEGSPSEFHSSHENDTYGGSIH